MNKLYAVYILTTRKNTCLYVGITNELPKRIEEHRQGKVDAYTKRYNVTKLIYVEFYQDVREAIAREKCLKRWKRDWKVQLIEGQNPEWNEIKAEFLL